MGYGLNGCAKSAHVTQFEHLGRLLPGGAHPLDFSQTLNYPSLKSSPKMSIQLHGDPPIRTGKVLSKNRDGRPRTAENPTVGYPAAVDGKAPEGAKNSSGPKSGFYMILKITMFLVMVLSLGAPQNLSQNSADTVSKPSPKT